MKTSTIYLYAAAPLVAAASIFSPLPWIIYVLVAASNVKR